MACKVHCSRKDPPQGRGKSCAPTQVNEQRVTAGERITSETEAMMANLKATSLLVVHVTAPRPEIGISRQGSACHVQGEGVGLR